MRHSARFALNLTALVLFITCPFLFMKLCQYPQPSTGNTAHMLPCWTDDATTSFVGVVSTTRRLSPFLAVPRVAKIEVLLDLCGSYKYASSNESVMLCVWCYNTSSLPYSILLSEITTSDCRATNSVMTSWRVQISGSKASGKFPQKLGKLIIF